MTVLSLFNKFFVDNSLVIEEERRQHDERDMIL